MVIKSTLKNSIWIGIFLLSVAIKTNGQQTAKPEICKNPPKGYELGGDFTTIPQAACLDYSTNTSVILFNNPAGIDKGSEEYIFNYKDGDSLTFTKQKTYIVNTEGIYWGVQKGTITEGSISRNVLICKSTQIIKAEIPVLEYSTCGPKTVNILIKDTPDNRKQSGYIIAWDEKDILTFKPTGLPLTLSHIYTEIPSSLPRVQGFYEWNGYKACVSQAADLAVNIASIQKIESLNYGKDVKIQMKDGEPGKEYYIQYKTKSAIEWIESTTKIKKSGANTLAEVTLTGFEPIVQYCFRLVGKDTCNYAIKYSNEMCTDLILSTEYTKGGLNISPNPAEEKIEIKSSGEVVRFIELIDMKGQVIYKGEISGENFNISPYQKGEYILRLYDANQKLLHTKTIVKW
ncbi:T9SS type A sorting domain-containing protein [Emticicia sp. BO119]|uniref:T9SS type A sorting domain-containing protein n=1 Tax=Emticicia sp. BO119 TaxID=2757768 RepID=UPI0015F012B2|nr:T9SS type A sorting domain-containing protein [Emticicia sp. BO119]MBA4850759.1 T9SS type A sorting domain-containing protein [Emticicia sp. BO119]